MTPDRVRASEFRYRPGDRDLLVRAPRANENRGEADLISRGVVVPVDHRADWAEAWGSSGRTLEVWSSSPDECLYSLVIDTGRSRLLPGHELWRVDRLVGIQDVDLLEAILAGLADLAAVHGRVLSVSTGISVLDTYRVARLRAGAERLGYRRRATSRGYGRTLKIDLQRDLDEVFAGLSASCRRSIRATSKNPIAAGPVLDPSLAEELDRLHMETMARTGGARQQLAWDRIIRYARKNPEAARLVGMYSTGVGSRDLLAFALGLRQGDHVEYRFAASTRTGPQAPLGYALAWDLIEWAKEIGATWFDFGGLPSGHVPDNVAGIVRFKESFGGESVAFREEWVLETRPLLESVRRGLSAAAKIVRNVTG